METARKAACNRGAALRRHISTLRRPTELPAWAKSGVRYVTTVVEKGKGVTVRSIPVRPVYAALLAAVTLIVVIAAGVSARGSSTYVVYLDGQELGYVSSEAVVSEFLAELALVEEERRGLAVKAVQDVQVEQVQGKKAKAGDAQVKELLQQNLQYDVYGYMITVNGKDTLAVREYEDYQKVIDELKRAYISGQDNAVIQAVVLNDKVATRKTLVNPDAIYSADSAANILLRGTDRREVYLVSRGDSLWTIARQNNMTVSEIQNANPHLAGSDRIKPGEEINLVVSEPLVNVSVTQEVVLQERIPFETKYQNDSKMYRGNTKVIQPGQHGKKEVAVRITQKNGTEISREVISETVIEQPKEQVVARGTAAVPAPVGTGRFLWPVSGGGKITSRYGARGRSFHAGVDIAASRGTAVLAADAGVVTQSGWSGGYGIMVTIDHGNGYVTRYAHNSSNLVSVGQRVQRGQQIARMGSTGNSTGPHVHFEVLRNGKHINPMQFF